MKKKISGHRFQQTFLANSIKKKHLSHAYIFSGPSGVGKKLIATEFAKLINCEFFTGDFNTNCNCIPCTKIKNGFHPDVHLFEFEDIKIIKVDQIREDIEKTLYLSTFESKFKIFIINDAHRMNFSAQNAFLKSLEEPPENTVIILITDLIEQILSTIRSRCQIIRFNELKTEEILNYLIKYSDFDQKDAEIIAKLSGGSIGKAINMDSGTLEKRKNYIKEVVNIDSCKIGEIFEFAEKLNRDSKSNNSDVIKHFFDTASIVIQDSIKYKIGFDENKLTNSDFIDEIKEFSEKRNMDELMSIFDTIENAQINIIRRNANKQLTFENLLLKIA